MDAPTDRLSYRVKDAAAAMGLPEKTVRGLLNSGQLGFTWVSRYQLIPRFEIERFLAERLQNDGAA